MKKLTALFLALVLCLSLCTAAFATGTSYAITNGTPESAKETNHGYISIDKTTAAEGETVTVTVNPAENYQLKSLTVTPVAPTEYNVTFDLNGITGTAPTAQKIKDGEKASKPTDPTFADHTLEGWYTTKDATTGKLSGKWDFDNDTVTADMTLYAQWQTTISTILKTTDSIPTYEAFVPDEHYVWEEIPEVAWVTEEGNKAFKSLPKQPYNAIFNLGCCITNKPYALSLDDTEPFLLCGNTYVWTDDYFGTMTCYMTEGVFTSLKFAGSTQKIAGDSVDFSSLNGTYSAPANITVADILPDSFPNNYDDGWRGEWENNCSLYVNQDKLVAQYPYEDAKGPALINLDIDSKLTPESNNYSFTNDDIKWTFNMSDEALESVTISGASGDNSVLNDTYSESKCIAAGTMITMYNGEQKKVEDLEIGDVIRTFDHEKGEVSSSHVCFIWESKNAANAFTLTFEDDIEVTVIEAHGFYDQEEQKYVFINLQNAEEYIGHRFYNADTNSWLALKSCEALNNSVDAYEIITSGDLNHMSNGMLSVSDDKNIKILANLFEYDDQMRFDAEKKKAAIEAYGLTPKEKIMELEGFIASDYDDYNLQYLNVAIGKGLTTWEWIEAFSDYCVENGWVDIYSGSETAEKNEAPKMLLMSATAPKTLLGSTPEPTPQDGIEINPNENGTYQFTMPGYAVTVTAVFEAVGGNPNPGHGYSAPSGHLVTSDLTSVTKVTVDGKAVDSKYYTVSGGNVTLTDAFMKTLANGKHTVKLYNGDVVATGTMTVSGNAAVVSAKTADMGVALYGVLTVSSLLGMGWVSKRKH